MKIEIKGIKNKDNEWMPQNQIYFSREIINTIIDEEQLKTNMVCKQGVEFDTSSQTLNNVVIDCNDYNNEFIFLIKSNDIIKDRQYHFAYVSSKTWNTKQKVVLTLTIDVITSNYDLFYNNDFKGKVYIERATNYKVNINDTHSDVCSNITNKITIIAPSEIKLNKKIDVFIDRNLYNFNKVLSAQNVGYLRVNFEKKGTIFVSSKENGVILGQQALQNINETDLFKNENLPNNIKKELERITNGRVKWEYEVWGLTESEYNEFKNAVGNYPIDSDNNLSKVDKIITDENNRKWITLPKIFNVGDSIYEDFEFDLPIILKKFDLSIHLALHREYFLVFNDLIKIPLNFIKLQDKIYAKRIVKLDGINYTFFYDETRLDSFYTLDITLQNSLNSVAFKQYERELEIAYATGQKGTSAFLENFLEKIASGGLSFIAGRQFGIFGLVSNLATLPFDLWSENKQEKYDKQKILSEPQIARTLLAFESLEKILFNNAVSAEWAYFIWKDDLGGNQVQGYTITNDTEFNINKSEYWYILVNEPTDEDQKKIDIDQSERGNIVNQVLLNYENILFDNTAKDHLFWQGKILPNKNPIDNFQLDFLNQILAKGIYIYKIKQDKFNLEINSTNKDFLINNNEVEEITDVEITSSNNDLIIKVVD